ncbi:MAG: hypothetical protein B7Z37_23175 [Verrucomicrobia bacterium 12-59-8]|nr:MAG: hypothetical protein B7Z37_23175 [Verrucomicrobia bacterium 12-59-8]
MRKHFKYTHLLLALLLAIGGVQLMRGQDVREMPEAEKKERAETQRLAASTRVEDRLEAMDKMEAFVMDYALLWQLMNDTDPSVRLRAIGAMTSESCTVHPDRQLSAELAQKMTALLEKEVTPEHIRTAFEPGRVKDYESGQITIAAETLNHLYLYHPAQQSPAGYADWQRRVLKPLFLAAAAGGQGPFSEQLHACMMNVLRLHRGPTLLSETLPVLMQKLDSPDIPSPALLETLRVLWSYHDLLSHDRPLHLMLLTQIAPRLDSLRSRILDPMKDGQDKEQAALLLGYYTEAIQTAGKRLPASPRQPQATPSPTQTPAAVEAEGTLKPPPFLPPLSPQEQQQRRTELQRLAASSVVQDRISAADEMVYGGIDPDLYRKLLNDPEHSVSEAAMDALLSACLEKPCPIPLDEARKMAALLEPEVTKERITTLYEDAQPEHRIAMTCHAALALNQLYRQYALLSSPSSYGHWQEEVLRYLFICVAGNYRDPAGENDELVLEVLRAISDPAALLHTVDLLHAYPNLDDIPAARQLYYLEELWAHPLLGEGRPMNLVLLQQLAPVWEPVRDHILRNIRDKAQPDPKATALLSRMDTAFHEAGSNLSLQPAVK